MTDEAHITVQGQRYRVLLDHSEDPYDPQYPWTANAYREPGWAHVRFCLGETRDDALDRLRDGIARMS